MGLRTSFDVCNDLGFPLYCGPMDIPADYTIGNQIFLDTFLATAREYVPVRTGFLQSSITGKTTSLKVECITECDYAQFVEFGTIKMVAQPYFFPALENAYKTAIVYWKAAYEKAEQESMRLYQTLLSAEKQHSSYVMQKMAQLSSIREEMDDILTNTPITQEGRDRLDQLAFERDKVSEEIETEIERHSIWRDNFFSMVLLIIQTLLNCIFQDATDGLEEDGEGSQSQKGSPFFVEII